MPDYDHDHAMTLSEYLSVLDPFLVGVTVLMVVGLLYLCYVTVELAIRAIMKEEP